MEKNCETKPLNFKAFIKSRWFLKPFIGIVLGGTGGFLYYYFVGCSSGSCPITGNPYMSIMWGGLLGFLLVKSPCSSGKC
jgi:hypothetical protein